MKAEERTISKVLTEQMCYQIPPYQRPYAWEKENAEQLLADMWEAYENEENEYFIGSLITIEHELDRRYEVVDGQQRLATLNVIFARLRDRIQHEAAREELGKRILPRNVLTEEPETPRLTLRKKDQPFFRHHILESHAVSDSNRRVLEVPQRHLIENAEVVDLFLEGKEEMTLRRFANYVLQNVYVVFVVTTSFTSAYRLFNVLNARGMPLSNADLIKNELFSYLDGQDGASEDLEERWSELEETVEIDRLDAFLGHHRTSIKANRARGSLHEEFKTLIEESGKEPFTFLNRLNQSARNYVRIQERDFDDTSALRSLLALQRVKYDEWIPPLLAYLNRPVPGLSEREFLQSLEKITMQNWVRRLGRTARQTVYFQLINAINRSEDASKILAVIRGNANNEEFLALLNGDIYGLPFAQAVLLRLEEATQDDSVTKRFDGRITIEHILPQALKDAYWKDRFSAEDHIRLVHKLGNLTPLAGNKNYKAQYYGFPRKKDIYRKRNEKVSFDLTKAVCDEEEWTPEAIEKRQADLLKLAARTWTVGDTVT